MNTNRCTITCYRSTTPIYSAHTFINQLIMVSHSEYETDPYTLQSHGLKNSGFDIATSFTRRLTTSDRVCNNTLYLGRIIDGDENQMTVKVLFPINNSLLDSKNVMGLFALSGLFPILPQEDGCHLHFTNDTLPYDIDLRCLYERLSASSCPTGAAPYNANDGFKEWTKNFARETVSRVASGNMNIAHIVF